MTWHIEEPIIFLAFVHNGDSLFNISGSSFNALNWLSISKKDETSVEPLT